MKKEKILNALYLTLNLKRKHVDSGDENINLLDFIMIMKEVKISYIIQNHMKLLKMNLNILT